MELGKIPKKITEKHFLVMCDDLDMQENEKLKHRTQGWHRGKLLEVNTRHAKQFATFPKALQCCVQVPRAYVGMRRDMVLGTREAKSACKRS